jgi:hypothetical protein
VVAWAVSPGALRYARERLGCPLTATVAAWGLPAVAGGLAFVWSARIEPPTADGWKEAGDGCD